MVKNNKQLYCYRGRLVAFNKAGNVIGSITVTTKKFNIPVKLVFVRNRNKADEYIILPTTNGSLSNSEVVRLYGNRCNIELFFRASKSLLCLGYTERILGTAFRIIMEEKRCLVDIKGLVLEQKW